MKKGLFKEVQRDPVSDNVKNVVYTEVYEMESDGYKISFFSNKKFERYDTSSGEDVLTSTMERAIEPASVIVGSTYEEYRQQEKDKLGLILSFEWVDPLS